MVYPDHYNPSVEEVNAQLGPLAELARVLLDRQDPTKDKPLIITLVGAGASMSAGLPSGERLQKKIYEKLVPSDKDKEPFKSSIAFTEEALNREAHRLFKDKLGDDEKIQSLTLFEFASVVSRFNSGGKAIYDVVNEEIRKASCRPLAYELLAHLAKHRFVDHFISVNFDELLDNTLDDEIPDRLQVIRSSDDIPGSRFLHRKLDEEQSIFLFKPFGSLSLDSYSLTPKETKRYGSAPVWTFMVNNLFSNDNETDDYNQSNPDVYLLVVGYDAAEPAFEQFVSELRNKDKRRNVTLYVINPQDKLSDSLSSLSEDLGMKHFLHIQLRADLVFDVLLQIMKREFPTDKHNVWHPIDRHKAVARCLNYCVNRGSAKENEVKSDRRQFEMELILQVIKSRGFFNIEAIADTHRLKNYATHAAQVIKEMCSNGVLEQHHWSEPPEPPPDDKSSPDLTGDYPYPGLNYRLTSQSDADLASKLLGSVSDRNQGDPIDEWIVERNPSLKSGWAARLETSTYREFLVKRFEKIRTAPEIEINTQADLATHWLFRKSTPLRSFPVLNKTSMDIFHDAFQKAEGKIYLYGIWPTGEWLLHENGWARNTIGEETIKRLSNDSLEANLIVIRPPTFPGTFTDIANDILIYLQPYITMGSCQLRWLDWMRHNRSVTLLHWTAAEGERKARGIYMRRRNSTPLVAPVYVEDEECDVLKEIFDLYKLRSTPATLNESITEQ